MGSPLLVLIAACSTPFKFQNAGPAAPDDSAAEDSGGPDSGHDTDTGVVVDSVTGWVNGPDGLPLAGAVVKYDDQTTTTGVDGRFAFDSAGKDATLTLTRDGSYPVTRSIGRHTASVRVGMYPVGVGKPIVAADGGVVTAGDTSTMTIPAGALGDDGVIAAGLVPFALDRGGLQALPAGAAGVTGFVNVVAAAAVVLDGQAGSMTAGMPIAVRLKVPGGVVTGVDMTLFTADGDHWVEAGTATLTYGGGGPWAEFSVSAGGVYAVGTPLAAGCVTVNVIDGAGKPIAGLDVRAAIRPTTAVDASWIASTISDSAGNASLPAPVGSVELQAFGTDTDGTPTFGGVLTAGTPGEPSSAECADAGTIVMQAGGCADGNVYGGNGGKLGDTPFVWGEGDPATSGADGSLVYYARVGTDFTLRGPGGIVKTFITSAGSRIENADCARLGNLQMTSQCLEANVLDDAGDGYVGALVGGGDFDVVSGPDGAVCLDIPDGPATLTAEALIGAQSVVLEHDYTVPKSGGTCWSGTPADGPDLTLPSGGCVQGTIYDTDGLPASGLEVWSSSYDHTTSGSDGTFCLETGGAGRASVWAAGYSVVSTDDSGPMACSAACPEVSLYPEAGAVPPVVIATEAGLTRIDAGGGLTTLLDVPTNHWLAHVTDLDSTEATEQIAFVHYGSLVYQTYGTTSSYSALDLDGWSSVRFSPDGTQVAFQGDGGGNSVVVVADADGSGPITVSGSAASAADGVAWSADGTWIASTRKDGKIETEPADASSSPVTVALSPCADPVWFDADRVAVYCAGDAYLAQMDGSGTTAWLADGALDERIRDVGTLGRVAYTLDNELHTCEPNGTDDAILYIGSPGTTYGRVRYDAGGHWVLANVDDPAAGMDVIAVRDAVPYTLVAITNTPTEEEKGVDWVK